MDYCRLDNCLTLVCPPPKKVPETSEIGWPSEIYSGYLRCGNTIDSVWHNEMIEWG